MACDTLFTPPQTWVFERSWAGTSKISHEESAPYCNFLTTQGRVTQILDKQKVESGDFESWIGLTYIHEPAVFWKGLDSADSIQGEVQISSGFEALVKNGQLHTLRLGWQDVGTLDHYRAATEGEESFDFGKIDELFFDTGKRILKFFKDAKTTSQRVERAALCPEWFPKIIGRGSGFYAYDRKNGKTLYDENSPELLKRLLLKLAQGFWKSVAVDSKEFQLRCREFYEVKTMSRLKLLRQKYPDLKQPLRINGLAVPPIEELLKKVPWEELTQGIPVFFHGDLQPDNLLYDSAQDRFWLLDWRQDFAGALHYGDLYYDLAKLNAGLKLPYDLIKKNQFRYEETREEATLESPRPHQAASLRVLEDFVRSQGHSMERVETLTALIYLNMAPLHHAPFDRFLLQKARLELSKN